MTQRRGLKCGRVLARILILLVETVLLAAVCVYSTMYLVTKGPSKNAGRLFVHTVKETSAIGFLADWFYSGEEIDSMLALPLNETYVPTDTSLITVKEERQNTEKGYTDAYGLTDEDGDGIILERLHGEGFSGYMMVVLDPARVIVGAVPEQFGGRGYTVKQFVERFDAVAGINGGAFYDDGGTGNGSLPVGLVVFEGKCYAASNSVHMGFMGLDADHILHVGIRNKQEAQEAGIQYGCSFGPTLVQNGEIVVTETFMSGLNPRTAVGQRADGAMLLMVIDGRQVSSLGVSYEKEAELMLQYGAVNATNLDGGSSSMMYMNGEYINRGASVIGDRTLPTAVLVLKEGCAG